MEKECSLRCSRPGSSSWLCVSALQFEDFAVTKVKGQRASLGVPARKGAHRGALCGLSLGEPWPRSEGRVRTARSPPPPGEGSGRAAAAPEASALGAGPADAVWVHRTRGRLSSAGPSAAAAVARAPHWVAPAFPRRRLASSTQRRSGRAGAGRGTLRSPVLGAFPPVPLCARPGAQPLPVIAAPRLPGRSLRTRRRSSVNPRALEVVEGDRCSVWLRGRRVGGCKLSCSLTL